MNKRDLIDIKKLEKYTEKFDFRFKDTLNELERKLNKGVFTQIKNAYSALVYIDENYRLWISTEKLAVILRTDASKAEYMVTNLGAKYKITVDEQEFIEAAELSKLIFKQIEQVSNSKTKIYLKFSEKQLMQIRDYPKFENEKRLIDDIRLEEIKKLKDKRIKYNNITHDELTGKELNKKTAEFSHIRSKILYRAISNNINNGLIVNKSTHDIITQNCVEDEEDLKTLCIQMNWNLDWYRIFIDRFGSLFDDEE